MNIKKFIIFCVMAVFSLGLMAQDATTGADPQYIKAKALYDNGDFDKCEEEARSFVASKKGMVKTSTYRLMALCRLAKEDLAGVRKYIGRLLKNDPFFTPSFGDPQRFIDIIEEYKNQEAGITTASRQAESVEEAPVPVTLITEEMIRHSGCQNLQQLLCLYVPGMTLAEGAETNIAMHGIYSLMQDKILIMIDGHRLNSSSTNAEAPDFRTSLDRIQQIEVLRGPASSLYGNCALTAVVNVITRKGASLKGGRVSATVGTQGTYGGSIVVGGGNSVLDIMGWGTFYGTDGFSSKVFNGVDGINTLYAHGYNRSPSYDIGMKGRWKDFTLSLNMQRSKQVPYMNVIQLPNTYFDQYMSMWDAEYNFVPTAVTTAYANYDYDKYQNIDAYGPGTTRSNTRIDLDYKHSFEKFDIEASGYINFENTSIYNVLGDSLETIVAIEMLFMFYPDDETTEDGKALYNIFNKLQNKDNILTRGVLGKMDWSGVTYGLQTQGSMPYEFLGEGSLVAGAQFELFSLSSNHILISGDYSGLDAVYSNAMFRDGKEHSISGFLQWKHKFPCNLILNSGLRYDHKERFDDTKLDKFSPRFSIIYRIGENFTIGGNYNYSFVDAPYIFRACRLPIFSGGTDMKPETMHGFSIGSTYSNKKRHLTAELETFYDILNDLCVINPKYGDSKVSQYLFVNAGKVRTFGVEGSAQIQLPRLFANLNATWQRIMSSERYISYNSQTYSTPAFHTNLTLAVAPYAGKGTGFLDGGKLWLRTTVQFQTKTYYPTEDLLTTIDANTGDYPLGAAVCEWNEIKPQCVVGLGASYDWKHIDIDLTLSNLFNNNYKIGSMLMDGVPRAGRQFLAKLTYKF